MLTVFYAKTRMPWVLPNEPKIPPIRIIQFILTIMNNEQHPCKRIRVDEDGALEKSTNVKNLIIEELKISMETTGGDVYWINVKNERHNIRIHNMIKEGLFNSNQQAINWLCAEETSAEVHRCKIHSALDNTSPLFV